MLSHNFWRNKEVKIRQQTSPRCESAQWPLVSGSAITTFTPGSSCTHRQTGIQTHIHTQSPPSCQAVTTQTLYRHTDTITTLTPGNSYTDRQTHRETDRERYLARLHETEAVWRSSLNQSDAVVTQGTQVDIYGRSIRIGGTLRTQCHTTLAVSVAQSLL